MRRLLNFLPVLLNCVALLAAIWIIVPAPDYRIWLFSVAASEWSLWLALIASFGIVGSSLICIFKGRNLLQISSLVVGAAAFLISIYPLLSVVSTARQNDTSLSFRQYFGGITNENKFPAQPNFTTYIFASIDDVDLKLDVYLPTAASENNGASVIVVHGGSWSGGKRSDFPQWNQWLAAQGYTIFDVDYRLASPNYLTATGDVKCAVRWVKSHAAEFKVAPERIALLGRSAGAHLALLAAYTADDRSFPVTCENENRSETVRAVVSFYAPTALLWAFDNPANPRVIDGPATLSRFLGGSPHDSDEMRERYILASPVAQLSARTPPTLLIHGGYDQLVREENMRFLDARLNEANISHKTLYIPYAQHGFDYNFNGFGSQIVQPEIQRFLNENTR